MFSGLQGQNGSPMRLIWETVTMSFNWGKKLAENYQIERRFMKKLP